MANLILSQLVVSPDGKRLFGLDNMGKCWVYIPEVQTGHGHPHWRRISDEMEDDFHN